MISFCFDQSIKQANSLIEVEFLFKLKCLVSGVRLSRPFVFNPKFCQDESMSKRRGHLLQIV